MMSAFAPGVGQGTALRPLSGCSCSFCSFAKNPNGVFRIAAGGSRNGGPQFKLFSIIHNPFTFVTSFLKKFFPAACGGPFAPRIRGGAPRFGRGGADPCAGRFLLPRPRRAIRCRRGRRRSAGAAKQRAAPRFPGRNDRREGAARPLPADGVRRRVTPSWRLPPSPSSPAGRAARRPAGWACA